MSHIWTVLTAPCQPAQAAPVAKASPGARGHSRWPHEPNIPRHFSIRSSLSVRNNSRHPQRPRPHRGLSPRQHFILGPPNSLLTDVLRKAQKNWHLAGYLWRAQGGKSPLRNHTVGQRLNLPTDTRPVAHTSFSLQPPAAPLSPTTYLSLSCEQTYKANPKVFLSP